MNGMPGAPAMPHAIDSGLTSRRNFRNCGVTIRATELARIFYYFLFYSGWIQTISFHLQANNVAPCPDFEPVVERVIRQTGRTSVALHNREWLLTGHWEECLSSGAYLLSN
jgi:hypothetical protein